MILYLENPWETAKKILQELINESIKITVNKINTHKSIVFQYSGNEGKLKMQLLENNSIYKSIKKNKLLRNKI